MLYVPLLLVRDLRHLLYYWEVGRYIYRLHPNEHILTRLPSAEY